METQRWLLPFTHGVDMQAIESVLRLVQSEAATLVAVSLVSVPAAGRSQGARLEHIQQSKDFLEAVKWKAARFRVPVELYEVFTADVIASIATLTHELHCDHLLLVSGGQQDSLLHAHELKHLLAKPPVSFMLLRLPSPRKQTPQLGIRLRTWLRQWPWRQQNGLSQRLGQEQDAGGAEEVAWSRAGENSRG